MFLCEALILVASVNLISGGCSPRWWPGNEGRYCYHVSEHRLTWGESQEYCWSAGGYLVEVDSFEEEESIKSILVEELGYWIGLTDQAVEGTWRWQESHQEPSYTNWAAGQPQNRIDEDCVCISGGVRIDGWHDCYCTDNTGINSGLHALCQKTRDDFAPSTTTPSTSSTTVNKTTTITYCDELCNGSNSGYAAECCSNVYCDCNVQEE